MNPDSVKDAFMKMMKCNFEFEYHENTSTHHKDMDMRSRDRTRITMIKFTQASGLPGRKAHLSLPEWNREYYEFYFE
jgi:hypothetical protein